MLIFCILYKQEDNVFIINLISLIYILRDTSSLHGSLIVGMEHRITQLETKMSDVDARASEEADCNANDRDLDRFIYSGSDFIFF